MKELKVTVESGVKTVEVLTGEAQKRPEPLKVEVSGLITAPYSFLDKRKDVIEEKACHLIVNESNGSLQLIVDEKNKYKDIISGSLKMNPDFEAFGINSGTQRDTFELADFIKMNRFFFADKQVAMKLISELKNFKAKVKKEIEASNNDRGNTRLLHDQVLDSNIPESFDITVPIFKGQPKQSFKVEINIQPQSFACSLISPDAKDIINEVRSELITKQVDEIKKLTPNIAILEV